MFLAFFLIGLIALVAAGIFYATNAPIGYEDPTGFHYETSDGRAPKNSFRNEPSSSPFSKLLWLRPALRFAALLLIVVFLPSGAIQGDEAKRNDTGMLAAGQKSTSWDNQEVSSPVIGSEASSRIFQDLCQRFTEVQ
jgi:hypothetical protein